MKQWPLFDSTIIDLHREYRRDDLLSKLSQVPKPQSQEGQDYLLVVQFIVEYCDILIAAPWMLRMVAKLFERLFFHCGELPNWAKSLNAILQDQVFKYDNFARTVGHAGYEWGGVPLMNEILKRNRYCPYCNADSIMAIKRSAKGRGKIIKAAFDHFFPAHRYPALSLSIYNLIPSCFRCNSQLKKSDFKFALYNQSPYEFDFDDSSRCVPILRDLTALYNQAPVDFDIVIHPQNNKASVRSYVKKFKLESLYSQCYSQEVLDVVRKASVLNATYMGVLRSWFDCAGFHNIDIDRLVYGVGHDSGDVDMYRVGKLLQDVRRMFSNVTW